MNSIKLTNGLCFHIGESDTVLFALAHDCFRIQVNDQIIAELPRECAEDTWHWLDRNLFNERHMPNEYERQRTETD